MRLLHRVGRRGAARRLRHARPPHRRPPRHDARGGTSGTAGPLGRLPSCNTGPANAASARRASCSGSPRSKPKGRGGSRRAGTSRRRCAPICAAAPAGSPSSTPPAARWASTTRPPPLAGRPPQPGAGRPGVPSSKGRTSRPRGPTWCSGVAALPTTRPPEARWSSSARTAPLAPDLRAARASTGRVQGRNSTVPLSHPVDVPEGEWALTLQTTWVEPAYVEPDASWCRPGDAPASPLANGGAFGGKRESPVSDRGAGAGRHRRTTPCDCCGGARTSCASDPSGRHWRWRCAPTERVSCVSGAPTLLPRSVPTGGRGARRASPGVEVEEIDVAGPPVSASLRGAGWAEVLAAQAVLAAPTAPGGSGEVHVAVPGAGSARVALAPRTTVHAAASRSTSGPGRSSAR